MKGSANEAGSQRGSGFYSGRKAELFEVLVFLFLIVPSMVLSFFAVKKGALSFALTAWATILRDFALLSLIFHFLWRNDESIRRLGWSFKKSWKNIAIGIGLFLPFYLGTGLLEKGLQSIGFSAIPDRFLSKSAEN